MNFDPAQISQMLNMLPYPIGKSDLVKMAKQYGMNDQIVGLLDRLPDKTYNSAQDLQNDASSILGKMGNPGNLGGGFKM